MYHISDSAIKDFERRYNILTYSQEAWRTYFNLGGSRVIMRITQRQIITFFFSFSVLKRFDGNSLFGPHDEKVNHPLRWKIKSRAISEISHR